MQVFLPYVLFKESAKALDSRRLIKQATETRQILNALLGLSEGWKNHPATKMWTNHEEALFNYLVEINKEIVYRGFKDQFSHSDKIANILLDKKNYAFGGFINYPEWLGGEIHQSHKNRLYCKGEIDIVCAAIKKHFKIKSIDKWLKEKYKKSKNTLRWADCLVLKQFCAENKIDIIEKNHYSQFGWENINPAGEYVWPV